MASRLQAAPMFGLRATSLFALAVTTAIIVLLSKDGLPGPSVVPSSVRILSKASNPKPPERLDFFVAGFEKCGTTYALKLFKDHPETDTLREESCYLTRTKESEEGIYRDLQRDLGKLSHLPSVKRGIKCPRGVQTRDAVERLAKWYPSTKLLFAVRHPVKYFRSFYNYRVSNTYKDHMNTTIPPIETLLEDTEWMRVSTKYARFEDNLMLLGKTQSSNRHHKHFPKTPFKVLIYSLEQVSDPSEERRNRFGRSLADFLGLQDPLHPAPRSNSHVPQHANEYPESVDICEPKYAELRNLLMQQGKHTADWIRDEFLSSPDVTVIDKEHFLETIHQWQYDPCEESIE